MRGFRVVASAIAAVTLLAVTNTHADQQAYSTTLSGQGYANIQVTNKFRCLLDGEEPTAVLWTLKVTNSDTVSHDVEGILRPNTGARTSATQNLAPGQSLTVVNTFSLPGYIAVKVGIDGSRRGLTTYIFDDKLANGSIEGQCTGDALTEDPVPPTDIPVTGSNSAALAAVAAGLLIVGAGLTRARRRPA